jgi:hypothetical protein
LQGERRYKLGQRQHGVGAVARVVSRHEQRLLCYQALPQGPEQQWQDTLETVLDKQRVW